MRKGPGCPGPSLGSRTVAADAASGMTPLGRADLRSGRALLALRRFEFHGLSFFERLVAVHLDLGVMGEQILAAILRRDESEALRVVEPLHGAFSHFQLPSLSICPDATLPETGKDQGGN